jgi:hypothetical protein
LSQTTLCDFESRDIQPEFFGTESTQASINVFKVTPVAHPGLLQCLIVIYSLDLMSKHLIIIFLFFLIMQPMVEAASIYILGNGQWLWDCLWWWPVDNVRWFEYCYFREF